MQWIEFQAAKSNPWKGTKQILCKCWKALDADRVRVIPRVCSISSRWLQRLSYNLYKALELQSISELKSPLPYKFLHNATAPPGLNFQAAQLSLLAQFCIYLHSSLAFCTFWWISPGTGLIGANIVHPLFSHTVAPNRTRLNIKKHKNALFSIIHRLIMNATGGKCTFRRIPRGFPVKNGKKLLNLAKSATGNSQCCERECFANLLARSLRLPQS